MSDQFTSPLSTLPQTTAQRYYAQYQFWSTLLTNLQAQLTARTAGEPINSYTFNAGEGSQSTSRMSLEELMDAVSRAERMVGLYYQRLYGRGLMNHALRRR